MTERFPEDPGAPSSAEAPSSQPSGDATGVRPVRSALGSEALRSLGAKRSDDAERDESLMHHGRKRREQRQIRRQRQQTALAIAGAAVLALVLLVGGGIAVVRLLTAEPPTKAAARPSKGLLSGSWLSTTTQEDLVKLAKPIIKPGPDPTPIFASYRGLDLHVPVGPTAITEIGFHQAARDYALHMTTDLKVADSDKVKRTKSTGKRTIKGKGDSAKLSGCCLRMWRDRPGKPDSAVDVGGKPGAVVYAPVTGKVRRIRHYKLYGRLADWEIHIQPDDDPDVDVVLIHVDDLKIKPGQRVEAGVTRIAKIRKISGVINSQLDEYTDDGGNHVHMQLNDTTRGDYKGLRLPDDAGLEPFPG
ncbi:MAG: hypothetical protein HY876_03550 [Coriobacteriales bacterium]|nr:hypothetical protein [Coriobacteriales bacterium]